MVLCNLSFLPVGRGAHEGAKQADADNLAVEPLSDPNPFCLVALAVHQLLSYRVSYQLTEFASFRFGVQKSSLNCAAVLPCFFGSVLPSLSITAL